MHTFPTVTTQAVIPTDAHPEITGVEIETATIHPAGQRAGLSLHFASLDGAIAWWTELGQLLGDEAVRRRDARAALVSMDESLRRVGAR